MLTLVFGLEVITTWCSHNSLKRYSIEWFELHLLFVLVNSTCGDYVQMLLFCEPDFITRLSGCWIPSNEYYWNTIYVPYHGVIYISVPVWGSGATRVSWNFEKIFFKIIGSFWCVDVKNEFFKKWTLFWCISNQKHFENQSLPHSQTPFAALYFIKLWLPAK